MSDPLPPEQLPETLPEYSQPPPPPPVAGTILPMEYNEYDDYVDEPRGRTGCSGCAWGVAGALGCLGLLVLPIIVLLAGGTLTVNGLLSGFQNAFNPPPVANIISSTTILAGIQPMGQLVSVSAQLAKADIFIGVQQGSFNTCGFSTNHVAQGTIEAGIDLTKVTELNIQYDETTDTYTILLPAAELTSCRIDFIRQYERSLTACNVDWDEARLLANYQAINEFRDDALESGLLDRAEQEARIALGNFITALTGARVSIVFAQPDGPPSIPASCQPDVPTGWSYDIAQGAWVKNQ
jgi:hypothetical protein